MNIFGINNSYTTEALACIAVGGWSVAADSLDL